jgi:HAMP domain-containing protein
MLATKPLVPNADMIYFSSQLNFGAILLIFLVTLTFVLHRGFGALSRIEDILDQVIKGNYSLRLKLRKGDTLIPLTDRINKLIDLLEKKK